MHSPINGHLLEALTDLYPHVATVESIVRRIGLEPEHIDLRSGSVQDAWDRVIHHARARNKLIALVQYAHDDAPERQDLVSILARLRTPSVLQQNLDEQSLWLLEGMRYETDRLRNEMEQFRKIVMGEVDRLREQSTLYSPKKRAAWFTAFILFCLPMALFILEVRQLLELQWPAALMIMALFWTVACFVFMFALGFIRELDD